MSRSCTTQQNPPQSNFDAGAEANIGAKYPPHYPNSFVPLHHYRKAYANFETTPCQVLQYLHLTVILVLIPAFKRLSIMDALSMVMFLATTILATVTLSPSPNFAGLLGLLVLIQLYPRVFPLHRLTDSWVASTIGALISCFGPASNALQSSTLSIVVHIGISALVPGVSVLAVWFDSRYIGKNRRFNWFRLAAFPAIWASLWGMVSLLSPFGRLFVWSPVVGIGHYTWLSSFLGPWGIDFVVAGWSVVLTEVIAVPLFQRVDPEGPGDSVHLAPFTDNPEETRSGDHPISHPKFPFALLLLALALPSLQMDLIPNPTYTTTTTPFTLGCVLPQTHLPHTKPHSPTLHEYINETKKMTNAKLVLWPEGSVRFDSEVERNTTFETIAREVLKGHMGLHIGLGFEDYAPESHNNRATKRNGFALLVEDKVVLQYYKRHLVPSMLVSRLMTLGFKLT